MDDLSKLTSGGVQTGISRDDPIMIAWEEYKRSEAYANTRKWALQEQHVDGSLWAAFLVGISVGRRTRYVSEWKTIDSAPKDGTHILLAPSMEGDRHGSREGFWTEMYGGVWYMASVGHLNGFWKPTQRNWFPPIVQHVFGMTP